MLMREKLQRVVLEVEFVYGEIPTYMKLLPNLNCRASVARKEFYSMIIEQLFLCTKLSVDILLEKKRQETFEDYRVEIWRITIFYAFFSAFSDRKFRVARNLTESYVPEVGSTINVHFELQLD